MSKLYLLQPFRDLPCIPQITESVIAVCRKSLVDLISQFSHHHNTFLAVDGGLFLVAPIYVVFLLFGDERICASFGESKNTWAAMLETMWQQIAGSERLLFPQVVQTSNE